MARTDDDSPYSAPETARTSFCWHYGGKEGREVFNLETTISGTPGEAEIENHITSAIRALGSVFRHGGRARRGSADHGPRMASDPRMITTDPRMITDPRTASDPQMITTGPRTPTGQSAGPDPGSPRGPYEWGRGRTGKNILLIHNAAAEPDALECPLHPGKTMKRRSNEGGSWLSHQEGDTYCTARIQMSGARGD